MTTYVVKTPYIKISGPRYGVDILAGELKPLLGLEASESSYDGLSFAGVWAHVTVALDPQVYQQFLSLAQMAGAGVVAIAGKELVKDFYEATKKKILKSIGRTDKIGRTDNKNTPSRIEDGSTRGDILQDSADDSYKLIRGALLKLGECSHKILIQDELDGVRLSVSSPSEIEGGRSGYSFVRFEIGKKFYDSPQFDSRRLLDGLLLFETYVVRAMQAVWDWNSNADMSVNGHFGDRNQTTAWVLSTRTPQLELCLYHFCPPESVLHHSFRDAVYLVDVSSTCVLVVNQNEINLDTTRIILGALGLKRNKFRLLSS